jgi:ubiquinone/menaquinone biosynthesis C-methylase UbiE
VGPPSSWLHLNALGSLSDPGARRPSAGFPRGWHVKSTDFSTVFDQDVERHGSYVYTRPDRLSSRMAFGRSLDLIFSSGEFAQRRVLDVGCGDGTATVQLWDRCRPAAVTAVDVASLALDSARRRAGARPIRFMEGDIHSLPFDDGAFEVVLLQSVLHHLDDPAGAIREAFRLGSVVVIHEPNGNNPGLKVIERVSAYHRAHHEKSYLPRSIRRWVRSAGARVVQERFGGFVPMFSSDRLARGMKRVEPLIEATPLVRTLACAVYVAVGIRGGAPAATVGARER